MSEQQDPATIAYYTVVADDQTGWTGGLLLLNRAGRPVEFQCTLPVRPTRAHEILYGPTLRDHLIGEVIGQLLVKRVRLPMSLLCCDQPEGLTLASVAEVPVALVVEAAEDQEGPIDDDTIARSASVPLAGAHLRVTVDRLAEVRQVIEQLSDLPDAIEPFERIREAIKEAHSQLARTQSRGAA
jgi:hypothetical protein